MLKSFWKRRGLLACVLAAAGALATGAPHANASVLLTWQAVPLSNLPEIVYSGNQLQTGAGAMGNGDGTLPPSQQTPGGLETDTILPVAGAPGSFPSSIFSGGTGFYDTTLTFTGLSASSVALSAAGEDLQPLGAGTFTLTSTEGNPGYPATEVTLLTGTIGAATISGFDGGTSGSVITSNTVDYTGGLIYGAFPSNFVANNNSFSIALTNVTPAFGIGNSGYLNGFSANASGVDGVMTIVTVPEPGSLALLGVVGAAALARRRRRTI